MLGGAIASVALQALIVWLTLGSEAFLGYYSMLPSIVAHADALEPKAFQSHSIRSLTRLLPAWIGVPAWLLAATLVLWKTASSWSLDAPLTVRFGLAMVASVLVSPHLLVYDAAVLVLPLIWFAAWFVQHGNVTALQQFGALTYALFFAFLAPSAALIYVQVSVPLMLWLFWLVVNRMVQTNSFRQGLDLRTGALASGSVS